MLRGKMTRRHFLKMGFLGMTAILVTPVLKFFGVGNNITARGKVSHKDARYYKNLAG